MIQNNLRTPQLAGFAHQLGCKKQTLEASLLLGFTVLLSQEVIQNESQITMVTIKIEVCHRPVTSLHNLQACNILQTQSRPATGLYYFTDSKQAYHKPVVITLIFHRPMAGLPKSTHKIRPAISLLQACVKLLACL